MIRQTLSFIIVSIFLSLGGCNVQQRNADFSGGLVTLYDAGKDEAELELPTQRWHENDACICILYGYGYNDSEFVSSMNKTLFARYGSASDGGIIYPLVYPADFKHGTKYYISSLYDHLENKNVQGLIILGAPEGTYSAIARLQDAYDGALPYPVISFFSQDDVLGMEYSADFVLDKEQNAEINGIVTHEETQDFVAEVPAMLEKSVSILRSSVAPFEKNAKLLELVKLVASGKRVIRYSDPETGLISINHFVLE